MSFQGFRIEHQENRTIVYPYGKMFPNECMYLEDNGDYIVHKVSGNKMGKLHVSRHKLSLQEIQEFAVVHLGNGIYVKPEDTEENK